MEQKHKFTTEGIPAEVVGKLQQDIDSMQGVKEGKYQLVYISPESLLSNPQWHNILLSPVYPHHLLWIVVDEARTVECMASDYFVLNIPWSRVHATRNARPSPHLSVCVQQGAWCQASLPDGILLHSCILINKLYLLTEYRIFSLFVHQFL